MKVMQGAEFHRTLWSVQNTKCCKHATDYKYA